MMNDVARISRQHVSLGCLTFTQVYKAGLYGDRYAYIAIGWYSERAWEAIPQDVDCSSAQIREAMKYVITIGNLELGELDATSVSGMTSPQLEDVLKTRLAGQLFIGRRARNAYDAVWSAALALNKTEAVLEQSGEYRWVCTRANKTVTTQKYTIIYNYTLDG